MDGSTIAWHGMQPYAADWSDESRLVAWTLADGRGGGIYIAFNSSHRPTTLELPHWHGRSWQLVSDTGKVRWLAQRAAPLARRLNCTHVLWASSRGFMHAFIAACTRRRTEWRRSLPESVSART